MEVHKYCFILGQLWKLDGKILKNKDGKWTSNANWDLPPEGSTGFITNVDTNMVLSVTKLIHGADIIEKNKNYYFKYVTKSKTINSNFKLI